MYYSEGISVLYHTVVDLLLNFQKWRLGHFAMKRFISSDVYIRLLSSEAGVHCFERRAI